MKAEKVKWIADVNPTIIESLEIAPGVHMRAWVDIVDMVIYHKINGELMAAVFHNFEDFTKHIEQISEP
jgi:hypothetical protein